jgi:hypothetical protein
MAEDGGGWRRMAEDGDGRLQPAADPPLGRNARLASTHPGWARHTRR